MSACLAVASGKGGVGKSVITANLAASIALSGTRVLIIDADIGLRSQDALLSLENRVVYDLVDLAEGECLPEQAVLHHETIPSLHLLPAAQFKRAKFLDPRRLSDIFRTFQDSYDYIIVDCPAGIERGLRHVLNAGVDGIIVIATPDDISLRSVERTAMVIDGNKAPRPSLIVNRLDSRLIRSGEMMSPQAVSEVLDLHLLGAIPEDPAFRHALLRHSLLINFDCEARSAVLRIASRIQGRNIPIPSFTKKSSIFRRSARRPLKEVSPLDDY